jgi:DNA-binding beta-propeller fold protein YncE
VSRSTLQQLKIDVVSAVTIIVALAACGGSGNGGTPMVSRPMQADVTPVSAIPLPQGEMRGPLVYISDSVGNFVDVFNQNGTLIGRLTHGIDYPADLFVDTNHNLYVANGGSGGVLKFKRGTTKAASQYRDVEDPFAPTMCADGTLYVAHGSVAVFAPRHHRPTGSLSDPYGETDSVSCDKAGNIFATATVASPPGYVVEFPAGSKKAKLLLSYLPNPVDVKPDPAGNLLVVDSAGGSNNNVTEYTETGSPTGKSMPTNGNWNEIAITPNGKELFAADQSRLEGIFVKFPNGKVLQTYLDKNFRQLGGIAYDPG